MKKDILKAYKFRYACKEFDINKKISEEDFNLILETGRLSPSSFGWEPWQILVIQDKDIRRKLRADAWGAQLKLDTASHFVIFLSRKASELRENSAYLKHMANDIQKLPKNIAEDKLKFFKDFMANDFALKTDREIFDWSSKQSYIALGNMLTTAAMLEIDSVPMEGFNREKIEKILEEENIIDSSKFGVSVMAAFGYRAPNQEIFPKTRRSFDDVIKFV